MAWLSHVRHQLVCMDAQMPFHATQRCSLCDLLLEAFPKIFSTLFSLLFHFQSCQGLVPVVGFYSWSVELYLNSGSKFAFHLSIVMYPKSVFCSDVMVTPCALVRFSWYSLNETGQPRQCFARCVEYRLYGICTA